MACALLLLTLLLLSLAIFSGAQSATPSNSPLTLYQFPPAALNQTAWSYTGTYGSGTYYASASSDNSWGAPRAFDLCCSGGTFSGWTSTQSGVYSSISGLYIGSAATTTIGGSVYTGEWLQIQLPVSIQLYQYTLSPQSNCGPPGCMGRAPSYFNVLGSNDGFAWTLVDSRANVNDWAVAVTKTFTLASTPGYFSYYRLVTLDILCSNSDNLVSINEWDLYAYYIQALQVSPTGTATVTKTMSPSPSLSPPPGTSTSQTNSASPSVSPTSSTLLAYPPLALTGALTVLTSAPFANGNYTAIASDYWSGSPADQAFDLCCTGTATFQGWLSNINCYNGSANGVYTGSAVTSTLAGVSYPGAWIQIQLPLAIQLYSNDGVSWVVVDSQSGITNWVSGTWQTFTVSLAPTGAWLYFRLVCISTGAGTDGYASILEWDLASDTPPTYSTTPTVTTTVSPTLTSTATVTPSGTRTASVTPAVSTTVTFTSSTTTTPTASASASKTVTLTITPSTSATVSASATFTLTASASLSTTTSPSVSPSASGSLTVTVTTSVTSSATAVPTVSVTSSSSTTTTATLTASVSPSTTSTATLTATGSLSASLTASSTTTVSSTGTITARVTVSPTLTSTVSGSMSASTSSTGTLTGSSSPTVTTSPTAVPTMSVTGSPSASVSVSVTRTVTVATSISSSASLTASVTASSTVAGSTSSSTSGSVTWTSSVSSSASLTASVTASSTVAGSTSSSTSGSVTWTSSVSSSASLTASVTASSTVSGNTSSSTSGLVTWTSSVSSSASLTASVTASSTVAGSTSSSTSGSVTWTSSVSSSASATPSVTFTSTASASVSLTATSTLTSSTTVTGSLSISFTVTSTGSCTPPITLSGTSTPSQTVSSRSSVSNGVASASHSVSDTATAALSKSSSNSISSTDSASESISQSVTLTPSVTPTPSPPYPLDAPIVHVYSFVTGPWSACNVPCGDGIKVREVYCLEDGAVLPTTLECTANGVMTPNPTSSCNEGDCAVPYWTASTQWSPCSSPCYNGTAASVGITTRPAPVCMLEGAVQPDAVCVNESIAAPSTSRHCNQALCPESVYVWRVSLWSPCVSAAGCGMGTRTRAVTCVDSTGVVALDSECVINVGPAPSDSMTCDTGVTCGCTINSDCGAGHYVCDSSSHQCVCDSGWIGPSCNTIELSSNSSLPCSGVIDVNHVCCKGVISAMSGECCNAGAVLAVDGACCDGILDVCGVCNGTGIAVDSFGVCCDSPLSASGQCCTDGIVDSCGVCGGTNACGAAVQFNVSLRVVGAGRILVSANGAGGTIGAVNLTSKDLVNILGLTPSDILDFVITNSSDDQALVSFSVAPTALLPSSTLAQDLWNAQLTPAGTQPAVIRLPVCGNQHCETGEVCTNLNCSTGCPADCPPFVGTCPLGLGVDGTVSVCSSLGACKQGSGQCACHAGYTGNACNECLDDYIRIVSHGPCIYLPGSQASCSDGVKNGNELGVDCGGPNCAPCGSSSLLHSSTVRIAFASGCVILVALAALCTWSWRRHAVKVANVNDSSSVRRSSLENSRRLGNPVRKVVVPAREKPAAPKSYQSVLPVPHDGSAAVEWD